MKAKDEYINEVIADNGYKNYLEIGTQHLHNFNKIKCDKKTGVDPKAKRGKNLYKLKSDEFFKDNEETFDVIFIDGLHHAEQVRKDIINGMKCLNDNGVIVLHDTLPKDEAMQKVPREQRVWTGDVYKAVVGFHKEYPKVKFETVTCDYGLTFIYPGGKKYRKHFEDTELTYKEFAKKSRTLLNIVE